VSLQSFSIGVGIIFTANKLVDTIKNFKSNASQIEIFFMEKCIAGQIFNEKKSAADKTYAKRCDLWTKSSWVFSPIDIVCT